MTFKKGDKKIAGRVAGTQNRFTQSVKEAFIEAFEKLGGVEALVKWGHRNPTDFYKLVSKLLPVDVNMAVKQIPEARVYPRKPVNEPGLSTTSEAVDSVH